MNMRMGIVLLWCGLLGATSEQCNDVERFLCDMQKYYCAATWICNDLEKMSINECAACWQQFVELLTHRDCQWFYSYDSAKTYEKHKQLSFRSFDDFADESADAYWVSECDEYHTWLTEHIVNNETGMLTTPEMITCIDEKTGNAVEREAGWDKTTHTELAAILWSSVPEAMSAFYLFYFEKQVNLIFKKLNYLAQEPELSAEHVLEIKHDQDWLRELYLIVVHKTQQLSEAQQREVAYHYRRVCEVYTETLSMLAQQLGVSS